MSIDELPVEILVCIFRALRDMHVHTHSHRWISVTHVCRDWRSAALDDAELWTQIYSLNPDCVQTFLTRTKNASLDIYYPLVDGTPLRPDTVVSILLPESSRFRCVELARPITAHSFLMHPFPDGAPLLSYLDLDYLFFRQVQPPAGPALQSLTGLAEVLPRICEHGLPALRRLRLKHWPVANFASLHGLVNPSLRSLVIIRPHMRHSTNAWAHLLTELPLLENLTLVRAFPVVTGDPPPAIEGPIPLIHLPHLSSLRLREDDPDAELSLLQHIVASTGVHITFSAHNDRIIMPFERYMGLLHTVSQKLTRGQHTKSICPTSLNLRLAGISIVGEEILLDLSVGLYAALDDTDRSYCLRFPPDTAPILMLAIGKLAPHHRVYPPLYDMLRTTFSWSTLRKLCLDSFYMSGPVDEIWGLVTFEDLFLQMTNLRVLSICGDNPTDHFFIRLGAVDSPSGEPYTDGGTAVRVLFPLLEILVIKQRHHMGDTAYEPLRCTLLSRKEAGYPIVRVHICLYDQRSPRSARHGDALDKVKAAVAPLESVGCFIDYCTKEDGDWHIQELQSERQDVGMGTG